MKIHIPKKITPLDEIKEMVKGKAPTALTVTNIKDIVLKLLEKEGIKLE